MIESAIKGFPLEEKLAAKPTDEVEKTVIWLKLLMFYKDKSDTLSVPSGHLPLKGEGLVFVFFNAFFVKNNLAYLC